jgi:hypothetical protein
LKPAPPCVDSVAKELGDYKATRVRRVAGEVKPSV